MLLPGGVRDQVRLVIPFRDFFVGLLPDSRVFSGRPMIRLIPGEISFFQRFPDGRCAGFVGGRYLVDNVSLVRSFDVRGDGVSEEVQGISVLEFFVGCPELVPFVTCAL